MVVRHKHFHPEIAKMRKALNKIENEIAEKTADRVVHELKEKRKVEKREHKTGKHKRK
jgi:hypothetical protein